MENNPFTNDSIEHTYMNQPLQRNHSVRMEENKLYHSITPPQQRKHYEELVYNLHEFSFNGIFKTIKVFDCENSNQETDILNLKELFKYLTLGGTLNNEDFRNLNLFIADCIYSQNNASIQYITIKKRYPISGTFKKKKIIKYSLYQYIPICNAIFKWLQNEQCQNKVIYSSF